MTKEMTTNESKALATGDWETDLAALAKEQTAHEPPTASNITLKAGVMTYNGQPLPDNKMTAIILDAIHEHTYYESDYDPDNIQPPECFALGNGDDMRPHPNAAKPQAETCADCPQFKWGSSPKGRGKACSEKRRLAMIPSGIETPDDVLSAEVATIKIPVTSVKNWTAYVNMTAAQFKRPSFAVETEISVTPDPKTQFKVNFANAGLVDGSFGNAIMAKREMAQDILMTPYEKPEEAAPAESGKKKKY